MTATEASRRFSDLLDAVEHGEAVTITRGHRPVATIAPVRRRTGADLRAALNGVATLDDDFEADIAEAMNLLDSHVADPWHEA